MAVRRAQRWGTKFGRWVGSYGVRGLAADLASSGHPVTVNGVHEWLAGRASPRIPTALAIQRLSGGAVRIEDISAHRERVQGERGEVGRT